LSAAGVEVYVCEEERAVSQALEDFKNGKLEKLKAPDVEGHWA
jgi:predicted Fe-Mo cluster-binding NifX family protein